MLFNEITPSLVQEDLANDRGGLVVSIVSNFHTSTCNNYHRIITQNSKIPCQYLLTRTLLATHDAHTTLHNSKHIDVV